MYLIIFHVIYKAIRGTINHYRYRKHAKRFSRLKLIENKKKIHESFRPHDEECFTPTIGLQEYETVKQLLLVEKWRHRIKKVVQFGGGNQFFLKLYLRRMYHISEIIVVDNKECVGKEPWMGPYPKLFDIFWTEDRPRRTLFFFGNISQPDARLLRTDAIVAMEILQHLYPDVLEALVYNVFAYIKPLLVIFTTANSDFKKYLPQKYITDVFHGKHVKHMWSRNEFESWATNICVRYPNYMVRFHGIGPGPEGTDPTCCHSQVAIFFKYKDDNAVANDGYSYGICTYQNEVPLYEPYKTRATSLEFPYYTCHRVISNISAVKIRQGPIPKYIFFKRCYQWGINWLRLTRVLCPDIDGYLMVNEEIRAFLKSLGFTMEPSSTAPYRRKCWFMCVPAISTNESSFENIQQILECDEISVKVKQYKYDGYYFPVLQVIGEDDHISDVQKTFQQEDEEPEYMTEEEKMARKRSEPYWLLQFVVRKNDTPYLEDDNPSLEYQQKQAKYVEDALKRKEQLDVEAFRTLLRKYGGVDPGYACGTDSIKDKDKQKQSEENEAGVELKEPTRKRREGDYLMKMLTIEMRETEAMLDVLEREAGYYFGSINEKDKQKRDTISVDTRKTDTVKIQNGAPEMIKQSMKNQQKGQVSANEQSLKIQRQQKKDEADEVIKQPMKNQQRKEIEISAVERQSAKNERQSEKDYNEMKGIEKQQMKNKQEMHSEKPTKSQQEQQTNEDSVPDVRVQQSIKEGMEGQADGNANGAKQREMSEQRIPITKPLTEKKYQTLTEDDDLHDKAYTEKLRSQNKKKEQLFKIAARVLKAKQRIEEVRTKTEELGLQNLFVEGLMLAEDWQTEIEEAEALEAEAEFVYIDIKRVCLILKETAKERMQFSFRTRKAMWDQIGKIELGFLNIIKDYPADIKEWLQNEVWKIEDVLRHEIRMAGKEISKKEENGEQSKETDEVDWTELLEEINQQVEEEEGRLGGYWDTKMLKAIEDADRTEEEMRLMEKEMSIELEHQDLEPHEIEPRMENYTEENGRVHLRKTIIESERDKNDRWEMEPEKSAREEKFLDLENEGTPRAPNKEPKHIKNITEQDWRFHLQKALIDAQREEKGKLWYAAELMKMERDKRSQLGSSELSYELELAIQACDRAYKELYNDEEDEQLKKWRYGEDYRELLEQGVDLEEIIEYRRFQNIPWERHLKEKGCPPQENESETYFESNREENESYKDIEIQQQIYEQLEADFTERGTFIEPDLEGDEVYGEQCLETDCEELKQQQEIEIEEDCDEQPEETESEETESEETESEGTESEETESQEQTEMDIYIKSLLKILDDTEAYYRKQQQEIESKEDLVKENLEIKQQQPEKESEEDMNKECLEVIYQRQENESHSDFEIQQQIYEQREVDFTERETYIEPNLESDEVYGEQCLDTKYEKLKQQQEIEIEEDCDEQSEETESQEQAETDTYIKPKLKKDEVEDTQTHQQKQQEIENEEDLLKDNLETKQQQPEKENEEDMGKECLEIIHQQQDKETETYPESNQEEIGVEDRKYEERKTETLEELYFEKQLSNEEAEVEVHNDDNQAAQLEIQREEKKDIEDRGPANQTMEQRHSTELEAANEKHLKPEFVHEEKQIESPIEQNFNIEQQQETAADTHDGRNIDTKQFEDHHLKIEHEYESNESSPAEETDEKESIDES